MAAGKSELRRIAMNSQVEQVNALLFQGEPANISIDEHSGYTGYKPQAVVDAMNEVLFGAWGFEEVSSEIEPGDKGSLAVAQVRVLLKDIEFRPVAWGQNRVTRGDIGDARKGAQTDAIKKALSYFSIGARAYHGLLDTKQPANGQVIRQQAPPAMATSASPKPTQGTEQAAANEAKIRTLLKEYKALCPEKCSAKTWYFKTLREAFRIPEGPLPASDAYTAEHVVALSQFVLPYRK